MSRSPRIRVQVKQDERPHQEAVSGSRVSALFAVRLILACTFAVVVWAVAVLAAGLVLHWNWSAAWQWSGIATHDRHGQWIARRTLWDFAQLLILPAALVSAAAWFNTRLKAYELNVAEANRNADRERDERREREAALDAYLGKMGDLIVGSGLRAATPGMDPSDVARVLTTTVLRRLDGREKGALLTFLYESSLIMRSHPVFSVRGADFNDLQLQRAPLDGADLSGALLHKAYIWGGYLWGGYLRGTALVGVGMTKAVLVGADFADAVLEGAYLRESQVDGANLSGATLSGGHIEDVSFIGARVSSDTVFGDGDFEGANFRQVAFGRTDLRNAILARAVFIRSSLKETDVTLEQLVAARTIAHTVMPDGTTIHSDDPVAHSGFAKAVREARARVLRA